MTDASRHDAWQAGDSYDRYMGRWSRQIAPCFLDWLGAGSGLDWLEVGCGTGALSAAILSRCGPKSLISIEPSEGFLAKARSNVTDARADFQAGDAQALPLKKRVARPGATVGFYVWDYPGGGLEFVRAFWTAATALDRNAVDLTEDRRFPFCTPEGLTALAKGAGLASVDSTAIELPTPFKDFEDYWHPFTLGGGPAPGYCSSLDPAARQRLKEKLHDSLPRNHDGSIPLKARAWAVKATVR